MALRRRASRDIVALALLRAVATRRSAEYKPKTAAAPKKHQARVPDTPPEALTLDGVLAGGHLDMPAGRTRAHRPPGAGGQGQAAAAAERSLEAAEEAAIAAASAAAAAAAVGLAEAEQAARTAARAAASTAAPTAAEQEQVSAPRQLTPSAPASHALSPRIRRPPRSTRPGWASARTAGMIGSVHLSRRSGAPAEARS